MHVKLFSGSILLLTLAATPAGATNYFPNTTQDQFGEDLDKCTLREAIQAASTDAPFGGCPAGSVLDVIDLSTYSSSYNITRAGASEDDNATGDFDFSGTGVIILQGGAAQRSRISANQLDRIIDVDIASGIQVYLLDLTLTDGDAGNQPGGAVRARGDLMVIQRTHVTNSRGSFGGGVYASQSANEVIIRDSSITRNRANGNGGGVFSSAEELLRVTNATFSENYATGEGGGLAAAGPVSLKSVTIAYNSGESYGGAYISATPATIDNSIFSNNSREFSIFGAADLHCSVTVSSLGYNMYQDRNCPFAVNWASDVQDDPQLGTLVDAGHGVPVHPLMPDSPAIDSGAQVPNDGSSGKCVSTDQRRFSRDRCDRGATRSTTISQSRRITTHQMPIRATVCARARSADARCARRCRKPRRTRSHASSRCVREPTRSTFRAATRISRPPVTSTSWAPATMRAC
jgi:CSLREA domain-containing protein